MRLASYNLRGRQSFGAVVGDGIVDLRGRLSRFTNAASKFSGHRRIAERPRPCRRRR